LYNRIPCTLGFPHYSCSEYLMVDSKERMSHSHTSIGMRAFEE